MSRLCLILCLLVATTLAPRAAGAESASEDVELRVQRLYKQIRCPVCPGQPISESEAPLSRVLREELRTKIEHGASDAEALEWIVERYGEGVLLRPPFASSALLWLAPLLLIGLALVLFRQRARRERSRA